MSTLIIGFDSDWLYPPQRGKDIQLAGMKANVNCTYVFFLVSKAMIVSYLLQKNMMKLLILL